MEIQQAIIHRVNKKVDTSGPESITESPRQTILPIDDRVNKLADDILKLYRTLSNGYGTLGEDEHLHRFPKYLKDYTDNSVDPSTFIDFSLKTLSVIAEQMSLKTKTTTSYPIFFKYTNQGRDWLLIAMLKLREGVGINDDTLELNDTLSFDISNVREAARIDIVKWRENTQPYLSFIKKGSKSDSGSSEYFRNALSCLEYTDATFNTDNAIKALDDYAVEQGYDTTKKQELRGKMYDYCKEKKDAEEPINLTSLSAMINDQEPDSFISFVRENEYEICETFSPSPISYGKLRRISKRFGTISIGFEVSDLVAGRVKLIEDDAIIITKPPKDLIEGIERASGKPLSNDNND